jgi:putative ABC transport system permease protein
MSNMAARFIDRSLTSLDHRPLLTALMVYSVGIGAAALIVAIALLREPSRHPNPQKSQLLYLVSVAPNIAGRSDSLGPVGG